jgi:phosphate transport system substrate-binding protein
MREVAASYEASRPWVSVTSTVLNNRLAAEALLEKEADLALLSWGSIDGGQEVQLWMEPFARDGIAVVVHPGSPFSDIGLGELHEIFRGRLQEVQGVVLTVVSREDGSGTRAAFESVVLGGADTTLNAVVVPSSEAVVDYVASNRSAIGYVSSRHVDDRVRALSVKGIRATDGDAANGTYPIWRELLLVSSGEPTGEARTFAQWVLSGGAGQVR